MTVVVNERTAVSGKGVPTDTGTAFVAGVVSGGPSTATLVRSIPDFESAFSARSGATVALWDWLDTSFREGLAQAYVGGYDAPGGYAEGLGLFDQRLGPGQAVIVGEAPSAAVYEALADHVNACNRVALLDVEEAADGVDDVVADGAFAQALTSSQENVGLFGSWVTVPSPAGVIGAGARTIPASAVIAGLCQRVDAQGNPNRAAGGRDFPLQYASGFVFDPNDTDRAACFTAGANMFKDVYGVLENYGFVTPIARDPATPFWQLSCSRARMWLKARAAAIAENYYMRTLDGAGKIQAAFGHEIAGACAELYEADGLFGDTPDDAYSVNTGVSVNTVDTAANAVLRAVVEARFSQYADTVEVDLVSVPVQGTVS
jgi:hypothetical protein